MASAETPTQNIEDLIQVAQDAYVAAEDAVESLRKAHVKLAFEDDVTAIGAGSAASGGESKADVEIVDLLKRAESNIRAAEEAKSAMNAVSKTNLNGSQKSSIEAKIELINTLRASLEGAIDIRANINQLERVLNSTISEYETKFSQHPEVDHTVSKGDYDQQIHKLNSHFAEAKRIRTQAVNLSKNLITIFGNDQAKTRYQSQISRVHVSDSLINTIKTRIESGRAAHIQEQRADLELQIQELTAKAGQALGAVNVINPAASKAEYDAQEAAAQTSIAEMNAFQGAVQEQLNQFKALVGEAGGGYLNVQRQFEGAQRTVNSVNPAFEGKQADREQAIVGFKREVAESQARAQSLLSEAKTSVQGLENEAEAEASTFVSFNDKAQEAQEKLREAQAALSTLIPVEEEAAGEESKSDPDAMPVSAIAGEYDTALNGLADLVGPDDTDFQDLVREQNQINEEVGALGERFYAVMRQRDEDMEAARSALGEELLQYELSLDEQLGVKIAKAQDNIRSPEFDAQKDLAQAELAQMQTKLQEIQASLTANQAKYGASAFDGLSEQLDELSVRFAGLSGEFSVVLRQRQGVVETAENGVNEARDSYSQSLNEFEARVNALNTNAPAAEYQEIFQGVVRVNSRLPDLLTYLGANLEGLKELVGDENDVYQEQKEQRDALETRYDVLHQRFMAKISDRQNKKESAEARLLSAQAAYGEVEAEAQVGLGAVQSKSEARKTEYNKAVKIFEAKLAVLKAAEVELEAAKAEFAKFFPAEEASFADMGAGAAAAEGSSAGEAKSEETEDDDELTSGASREVPVVISSDLQIKFDEIKAAREARVKTPGYIALHGTEDEIDTAWDKIKEIFSRTELPGGPAAWSDDAQAVHKKFRVISRNAIAEAKVDGNTSSINFRAHFKSVTDKDPIHPNADFKGSVVLEKHDTQIVIKPAKDENNDAAQSKQNAELTMRVAMAAAKASGQKLSLEHATDKTAYGSALKTLLVTASRNGQQSGGWFSKPTINEQMIKDVINQAKESFDTDTFTALFEEAIKEVDSDHAYVKRVQEVARAYQAESALLPSGGFLMSHPPVNPANSGAVTGSGTSLIAGGRGRTPSDVSSETTQPV